MPRFMQWVIAVFNWRNYHPTFSCIMTGLWGIAGLIGGIVCLVNGAEGIGVILGLAGVAVLGTVVYAAYDTGGFQHWQYQDVGTVVQRHSFARSVGPLTLCIVVFATVIYVVLLYIASTIMSVWASSKR